jgi:hypothetical protein
VEDSYLLGRKDYVREDSQILCLPPATANRSRPKRHGTVTITVPGECFPWGTVRADTTCLLSLHGSRTGDIVDSAVYNLLVVANKKPETPIDIILAGLRTDAELLKRLLAVIPADERAVRKTVLREINAKIAQLESMVNRETQPD